MSDIKTNESKNNLSPVEKRTQIIDYLSNKTAFARKIYIAFTQIISFAFIILVTLSLLYEYLNIQLPGGD